MNLLNMKNMDVLKSQPIKIFNSQLLKSDNQKIYGPFCQYFSFMELKATTLGVTLQLLRF